MRITKDQIMGALPSLSQDDLKAIKTLAGALLQRGAPDTQNNPENAQGWLFVALAGVLNMGRGLPGSSKPFNKNAPVFLGFVAAYFAKALHRKVDALAVMTALLRLISADLKAKHVPVTFNTMSNNLPRVAEIYEVAFPGYLDSGIAELFIGKR